VKTLLTRLALAACATVLLATVASAQDLPAGVTEQTIADGEAIFKGAGTCFACHGRDAKGIPSLGADLTDEEWTHADGTFESIVATINSGAQAASGAVMPPKGGPNLSEEQVKAVAAYVWSLTNK
jgi:cbb3-type cytochrome c oxidase subunit III